MSEADEVRDYLKRMAEDMNSSEIWKKNKDAFEEDHRKKEEHEAAAGVWVVRDGTQWPRRVICQKCYSEIEYNEPATYSVFGMKLTHLSCPVCGFNIPFDGEILIDKLAHSPLPFDDAHWR